jgi:hypothetical protein
LAALRVRNRILDVLRFGTPMAGQHESTSARKKQMAGGDFDMAYALGANGFFTKTKLRWIGGNGKRKNRTSGTKR